MFAKCPDPHPLSFFMRQMASAEAEYAGKCKQDRNELFLIEMRRVVSW